MPEPQVEGERHHFRFIEEFLAFERASPEKHQFWSGEVFLMSGGTEQHADIAANVLAALHRVLKPQGCRVYGAEMRVFVPSRQGFTYPDVTALCGGPRLGEGPADTLLKAQLIVEVLSDGTEAFDRGDKFHGYQSIDALQHYLLASQHERLLELYTRQADGTWVLRNYGAGTVVFLQQPEAELRVDDVYLGVSLVPRSDPPSLYR